MKLQIDVPSSVPELELSDIVHWQSFNTALESVEKKFHIEPAKMAGVPEIKKVSEESGLKQSAWVGLMFLGIR